MVLPIVEKPEQEKYLSGDEFINQTFGKIDNDPTGETFVNEAVRMSRYINNLVKSMVKNNSIVGSGFDIESIFTENTDLYIIIGPGKLVQDSTLINIPYDTKLIYKDFTKDLPDHGRLVLYTDFKFTDKSNIDRPLKLTVPHDLRNPTPPDQTKFNPFKVCVGYYDEATKTVDGWNVESSTILLTIINYTKKDTVYTFDIPTVAGSIIINGQEYNEERTGRSKRIVVDGGLY